MNDEADVSIQTRLLPHVSRLQSYVPGKPISSVARDLGLDPRSIIKLASNENPLGMSPAARQVVAGLADNPARYPDGDCFELRAKLAQRLNLDANRILPGAGSSELIVLAARAFLAADRAALTSQYAFISYEIAVHSVGARAILVPARNLNHDPERMLDAIDANVRVIFLASPNNPTGTLIEPADIERFVAATPADILIVLDEAYREYVPPERRPNTDRLLAEHANLLVLRTFSKAHGLAGLRIGYGIGSPPVIDGLRRLQLPFSVSVLAQRAAIAALDDTDFVEHTVSLNRDERARLCEEVARLGFEYIPSYANFVLLRVGDGAAIFQALLNRGVIVRPMKSYGLPEWIRVSIGLPEENTAFLEELRNTAPRGPLQTVV